VSSGAGRSEQRIKMRARYGNKEGIRDLDNSSFSALLGRKAGWWTTDYSLRTIFY
jgi:hypothetical protein